jgi:ribosomal protein L18E
LYKNIVQINIKTINSHFSTIKLDVATMNCVRAGNSEFVLVKASVIFGTTNTIKKVTIKAVKLSSIIG